LDYRLKQTGRVSAGFLWGEIHAQAASHTLRKWPQRHFRESHAAHPSRFVSEIFFDLF
jgi:hypothetical protein